MGPVFGKTLRSDGFNTIGDLARADLKDPPRRYGETACGCMSCPTPATTGLSAPTITTARAAERRDHHQRRPGAVYGPAETQFYNLVMLNQPWRCIFRCIANKLKNDHTIMCDST